MESAYYNPKNPGSLGGIQRLKRETKQPVAKVERFLKTQRTYQLHKPRRVRFPRRKYVVTHPNDLWQADLADFQSLKDYNDGYAYVLVVIDVFSKVAWTRALKQKTAEETLEAIKDIIETSGKKPDNLMTDMGGEFVSRQSKEYFKTVLINFYTATNPDTKAAIAERCIRTLKGRIYRHLTKTDSKRYIDVLQDITHSYNNSKHRTIGMKPSEVNAETESTVRERLMTLTLPANLPKFKFRTGNRVRIAIMPSRFSKSYTPQWTNEVFTVWRRKKTIPPTYTLKDLNNEPIIGSFYEPELQHILPEPNRPLTPPSPEIHPPREGSPEL